MIFISSGTVLLGDAAHCTGGVSGQGCSSALKDRKVTCDSVTLSGLGGACGVAEAKTLEFRTQIQARTVSLRAL